MGPNWKALAPHRPLDPGEPGYVPPPSGVAERIARSVATGTTTVLVAGPVGVGKSTELVRAASLLQDARVACLVQLDRYENIRRLTPDQMLLRLAGTLVEFALESLSLNVSANTRAPLVQAGVLSPKLLERGAAIAATVSRIAFGGLVGEISVPPPFQGSAISILHSAISEVTRLSQQSRVAFLIDGLEKLPEGPDALEVLAALGQLGEDVDLILAVPWFVAFSSLDDVIRPGAHLTPVPASEVEGVRGESGRQFLLDVLVRRLGLSSESLEPASLETDTRENTARSREVARKRRELVLEAARCSGGLPRTFLQLMADAAQYAQLRRGDDWPNEQDLADAVADQRDSFRRALLPGDTEALRRVDGTDGREMDLGRKIRLLARGVILERQRDHQWVMDVHPLVRPLLGGSSGA